MTTTNSAAGRREWIALAVLCLPLLIASMDVSVLFFAVPKIALDLDPSATQMLWIFDIYGFVLAGLLLTMGSIGDRIGRRRLLLIGAATFSAASLLAAYSTSAEMLIGARALLGVGGATLMPSTLALVRNLFPEEADRRKAIAIWSATMSSGIGLGPVLGGLLLQHFWWGSVFLINVPIMVALLATAPFLLPEFRVREPAPFDGWSAVLSLFAILPVIYAIKETATTGWSIRTIAIGVAGLLLATAFVIRQRRAMHPMVEPAMFRDRRVAGAVTINIVAMFGVMGNAIVLTQYLQSVLGMSPLRAALWAVLPSVAVAGAAPVAASVAGRRGRPVVMASGFAFAAIGFAVLATIKSGTPLAVVLIGAAFIACGSVATLTLVTDYVLSIAPPERAGAVGGLFETSSEFGGALGIAVLGSVLAAGYRHRIEDLLPSGLAGPAHAEATDSLAGALVAAGQTPGSLGSAIIGAGRTAYLSGMRATDIVAGATMLAMAAITIPLLRRGISPTTA